MDPKTEESPGEIPEALSSAPQPHVDDGVGVGVGEWSAIPESLQPSGQTLMWQHRYYVSFANVAAALLGAAVVGAVWVAVALAARETPLTTSIVSEKGELKVRYTIETGPGSAEWSEIDEVTRIDFQPGCVVLQRKNGRGLIFFDAKTRSLSWGK